MEIVKPKKAKMRVANYFMLIEFCFLILDGCKPAKSQTKKNSNGDYEVVYYKSTDNFSRYIMVKTFLHEDRSEQIYATYVVNDVIHGMDKALLKTFKLNVMSGIFDIEALSMGQKVVRLDRLKIVDGDSVHIKFYLKDGDPFHGPVN